MRPPFSILWPRASSYVTSDSTSAAHSSTHGKPMSARPAPPQEMFRRGRVDHLALAARDEEALEVLRQRLVEYGACEGNVTDFGSILSVWFMDPDGMELEVCCIKTGANISDVVDPYPATGATA